MAFCLIVNPDQCNGCEKCLEVCSAEVYEMRDGKAFPLNAEQCTGCESCVEVCKEQAVSLEELTTELSRECSFLLRDIL